jgi:glycosyltransferase involved in cell wall biosynthesis
MGTTGGTLYVTTGLHGGGAERLLTTTVLQRSPTERVRVVCLTPGGVFRPAIEAAGVAVTDLGMRHRHDGPRCVAALARSIRDDRPDVIYAWMYHANVASVLARTLAGRPRAPLFWANFCTDGLGPTPRWSARLLRRAAAWLSSGVDGVIYNAEAARDYHRQIGFREPRSIVLGNVIDTTVFRRDRTSRLSVRAEIGLSGDDLVVAAVARVDPMKDWGAVRQAVHGIPGVVTVAIGDQTDRLPPQPGFVGLGWRNDVERVLGAADMFVLGSAFGEGASLALGEAMLCGLPCIVTDVGDNALTLGDAGVVVPPRQPLAIRAAIEQLAADPARRESLGRAAQARALEAMRRPDTFARLRELSLGAGACR